MKKKLLSMCLGLLFCGSAMAQMEILYGGASLTTTTLTDGTTLVQFPEDVVFNTTDFQNKISVTVDGSSVANNAIVPNPATTFITDNEIETFVYGGKAYSFRFTAGEYFTVVMFSDPHVTSEDIQNTLSNKTEAIATMGKSGGKTFSFESLPGYTPTADLVCCLGDLDQNRDLGGKYFTPAIEVFSNNEIPFITILGNHDIEPDYYNDNSVGFTYAGHTATKEKLDIVKDCYTTAANLEKGITSVETITDANSSKTQMNQYTFIFRGVRFYCANNYWWQKPYSYAAWGTPSYDSGEGTINALNTFVESHKEEASIWLSHFPFIAQGDAGENASARWWLDQNYPSDSSTPKSILPGSYSNEYYTSAAYTTTEGITVANNKKKALADIIAKTKNPRHFSGHAHINDGQDVTATNGIKFRDHTIQPIKETSDNAILVLCKSGVGVVEVKRVTF